MGGGNRAGREAGGHRGRRVWYKGNRSKPPLKLSFIIEEHTAGAKCRLAQCHRWEVKNWYMCPCAPLLIYRKNWVVRCFWQFLERLVKEADIVCLLLDLTREKYFETILGTWMWKICLVTSPGDDTVYQDDDYSVFNRANQIMTPEMLQINDKESVTGIFFFLLATNINSWASCVA